MYASYTCIFVRDMHACICINHQRKHDCEYMHDDVCKYLCEHWCECMHFMHTCQVHAWPCMHIRLRMYNMHMLAWVWRSCMLNMSASMSMHACTNMHVHMYACIHFMHVCTSCTCMQVRYASYAWYACIHMYNQHLCIYMHACACIHMDAQVCIYMQAHACIHMHLGFWV